jgi:hypothetical protein
VTHHDDNDAPHPLDDLAHIYCRAGVHGDELARALESLGWGPNVPATPARVGSPAELDAGAVALVRRHYEVECDLNDPRQGTYRSHVGILLNALDALRPVDVTPTPVEVDDATVERAARAWGEYIAGRVDAEVARTGVRWTGPAVDRVRKQERRRSFEAGYRAALAAARAGETKDGDDTPNEEPR